MHEYNLLDLIDHTIGFVVFEQPNFFSETDGGYWICVLTKGFMHNCMQNQAIDTVTKCFHQMQEQKNKKKNASRYWR
jgi:hypothetical protein